MEKQMTWKDFIFSVLSILIIFVAALAQKLIMLLNITNIALLSVLLGLVITVVAVLLSWLLSVKIIKQPLDYFRITKCKISLKWVIVALLLPILSIVTLMQLSGNFYVNQLNLSSKITVFSSAIFVAALSASVMEELIFRGFIMTALEKKINRLTAILLPSIIFAALHVMGRDLSFVSFIFLLIGGTVVGVLLSLITIESGSVWNSVVVHAIWNLLMVGGIISVTSQPRPSSLFNYVLDSKSILITGGDFGIESSLICVIFYIVFIIYALLTMKKNDSVSEEIE